MGFLQELNDFFRKFWVKLQCFCLNSYKFLNFFLDKIFLKKISIYIKKLYVKLYTKLYE